MIVEHLTFSGDSQLRDTQDITLTTLQAFKGLQSGVLFPIPKTELTIKATIVEGEGAIFDLMKKDDILFTNVCSYQKPDLIEYVKQLAEGTLGKMLGGKAVVRQPKEPNWLFTIPVNPFAMFIATPQELSICGEIELYIYYSIYLNFFSSKQ